jgi:hypothetical protein
MATVAVFIALGGTSYAAIKITGKNVKNGSLTGADIKSNSITGSDIKSLTAKDFKRGQLPGGDNGANGGQGPTGPQGAAGSALGFGRVAANGTLTLSKNVTVTVGSGAAGAYCIDAIKGVAQNITASITGGSTAGAYPLVDSGDSPACPDGTQVLVTMRTADGSLSAQPFYFTIN